MQNYKSHVSVQVGPEFDAVGKWHFKLNAEFSDEAAKKQLEALKQGPAANLDLEWSIAGYLDAAPGKAPQLQDALLNFFQQLKDKSFFDFLEPFDLENPKFYVSQDRLWFSFKLKPEMEQEVMEPFNMIYEQGLSQIAHNQTNQIKVSLASNYSFNEAIESFKNKERIMSVLLRSLRLILEIELSPQLGKAVQEIIEAFDPETAQSPPFNLMLKHKNFKADFQLKSSEEVPEFIRLNGFFGKRIINKIVNGEGKFNDNVQQLLNAVLENIGTQGTVYFTIPQFLAANLTFDLSGLGALISTYGKAIYQGL